MLNCRVFMPHTEASRGWGPGLSSIFICLCYTLYTQPAANFMHYFQCTCDLPVTCHVRSGMEFSSWDMATQVLCFGIFGFQMFKLEPLNPHLRHSFYPGWRETPCSSFKVFLCGDQCDVRPALCSALRCVWHVSLDPRGRSELLSLCGKAVTCRFNPWEPHNS